MLHTVRTSRYGTMNEREFLTLSLAAEWAWGEIDANTSRPISIKDSEGNAVWKWTLNGNPMEELEKLSGKELF